MGALADGTRRSIVARLADGPMPVGVLAAELPVTRSAVSQHLKVLKDAGLVSEEAAGTRRFTGSIRWRWPRYATSSTPSGTGHSLATPTPLV